LTMPVFYRTAVCMLLGLSFTGIASCTNDRVKLAEPVATEQERPATQGHKIDHQLEPKSLTPSPATPGEGSTKQNAEATTNPLVTKNDPCDTSTDVSEDTSIFLPGNKVFITRVMSPCLSATGQRGHKKNAGWMAMGFPCTGGEGRIDWKGTNHLRPKMVSFLMETSCDMAPRDNTQLKKEASQVANLSLTAPLIALNPFMIQYWEVSGLQDADTSLTVDLRTPESLGETWSQFIKGTPIKVFLVGRENAWVPGNKIYGVNGELIFVNKNRFTFKVIDARLLAGDELSKVKARCEKLRPVRSCSEVF
jgi:hypothetical protein